jgi:non-specific serine/threonine protein kinase
MGAALRRFWWSQGYISEGVNWLERALEASKGKNIPLPVRAAAQVAAGTLTSIQSNYEKAISFLEEALAILSSLEDKDGMAKALGNLGMALGRQGQVAKAREVLQECLRLDQEREDLWGVAYDLSTLGDLAYYKKDLEEARDYFSEASSLYQALGDSRSTLICWGNLAEVNRLMGDFLQSLVQHVAVLEALQDSTNSNNSIIPGLLQPVAHLYLDMGDPANSALLLSSSATLSEQSGIGLNADARTEFDEIKEAVRQLLSPEVFRVQWEQGRRLSGPQAVDYTLSQLVKTIKKWSTPSPGEIKAGQELSDREKEVADLVAQRLSNRQIASRLGISKKTVDNHLHNVLTKLGAKSRADLTSLKWR